MRKGFPHFNKLRSLSTAILGLPNTKIAAGLMAFSSKQVGLDSSNVKRNINNPEHPFYNYTSGRWLYNERLRLAERRRVFDAHQLCSVAAKSIAQSTEELTTLTKIAEGGSYRIFEATFKDGTQVIIRIPYPCTLPLESGIASEVATMEYLRLHGIPIPKVLDWSSSSDNAVQSPYMIIEKVQGKELEHTWYTMTVKQRMDMVEKIVDIEKMLFALQFPASGSIYFKDCMGAIDTESTVPLAVKNDRTDRFRIGPSTEYLWWYQKRNELAVDKGPWKTSGDLLSAIGRREYAWLQKFGKRRFPREALYKEFYDRQEVNPQVQMNVLQDYLKVAPHIVPDDEEKCRPAIRHPDLSPNNIFVSEAGEITGVIDWQHSVVLPIFIQAKIPKHFQNYGDDDSENFRPPKLPANFDSMDETEKETEMERYRRRQLHFFYKGYTNQNNKPHYRAMGTYDLIVRNRLYDVAGRPWEGDNTSLKAELIQASEYWPAIASLAMKDAAFPVKYPDSETAACLDIDAKQKKADAQMQHLRDFIGVNIEGWVPMDGYELAREKERYMKQQMLDAADTEEERKEVDEEWPFQDYEEVD